MTAPAWFQRDVSEGDRGGDVWVARKLLGCVEGRDFDLSVTAAVRGAQLRAGLPVTGVLDERTAAVLGDPGWAVALPSWWDGPVGPGSSPEAVGAVSRALGGPVTYRWTRALERAVRRAQGQHGIAPTGRVCEETARCLQVLPEAPGRLP